MDIEQLQISGQLAVNSSLPVSFERRVVELILKRNASLEGVNGIEGSATNQGLVTQDLFAWAWVHRESQKHSVEGTV